MRAHNSFNIGIIFGLACLLSGLSSLAIAKESLKVSLMFSSGQQRSIFVEQMKQFEQEHPEIEFSHKEYEQENYKPFFEEWLSSEEFHSDVFFWFAGAKLRVYVNKGWIEPIDDLWQSQNWDTTFTKGSKSAVTVNNQVYGLPMSYYQWGMYYLKSVFEQYHLEVPTTWEEFLKVGETLLSNGITPITLGSKYRWTAAGWFDYLNLRINGAAFHQDLMDGKVPYNDPRVKDVFTHWKALIDKKFFLEDHNELDWRGALPYLYRAKAGILLMGNFLIPQVPPELIDDVGFFRFPQINPELPFYEEAPMDILIIPKNASNKQAAKEFLKFMARADIQYAMNSNMGMISPNKEAKIGDDRFIQAGAQVLGEAQGISQFYDRDTPPEMFEPGMDAMIEFMKNPETIDQILEKLEQVRQQVFK